MIYFDLDGVIRNLTSTVTPSIEFNFWSKPINGKSFTEYFDENLHFLLEAPPTEYYSVISNYSRNLTIITSQPENWQEYTSLWIKAYLPNATIIFDSEKLHLLSENDLIVEDYPLYEDYSQVILIDKPYNQDVKNPLIRIKNPKQLQEFLG